MGKSSTPQTEQRIFTVMGWIIDGVQDYVIFKNAKETWNVGPRQIRRYIAEAYKRWKADAEITIEEKRHAKIAELKQLRRGLLKKYQGTPDGIKAVMVIEKEIIRLENITPPRRVEVSGNPDKPLVVQQSPFLSEKDENDYREYLLKKYSPSKKK